jgi:hypothetical protein
MVLRNGDVSKSLENEILSNMGVATGGEDEFDDDGLGTNISNEDDFDETDEGGDEDFSETDDEEDFLTLLDRGQEQRQRQEPRRQEQRTRQQQQRQEPQRAGYTIDKQGRLHYKDGQGRDRILEGPARRFYQDLQKVRAQHRDATAQNEQLRTYLDRSVQIAQNLQTRLKAVQESSNLGQTLGLNGEETAEALRFAAQYKKEPMAAIKAILTEAAARGIKVGELGVSGGLDAGRLAELITSQVDGKLKPVSEFIKNQEERERRAEADGRLQQEVASELQGFIREFPEAKKHLGTINSILKDPRYKGWTLREAWLRLQIHLSSTPGQRTNHPQSRSRPMGRGRVAPSKGNEVAPVNRDYKDIINGVLDDLRVVS